LWGSKVHAAERTSTPAKLIATPQGTDITRAVSACRVLPWRTCRRPSIGQCEETVDSCERCATLFRILRAGGKETDMQVTLVVLIVAACAAVVAVVVAALGDRSRKRAGQGR
jgi:hypothetical protein